jgi:hypothetical protein
LGLIAQLDVTYADGSHHTMGTDSSWEFKAGPTTFWSWWGGEDYNVAICKIRLPGMPHPSGNGDPGQLRVLLEAIHGIRLDLARADLAPARSFMGGGRWFDVMTAQAIPY